MISPMQQHHKPLYWVVIAGVGAGCLLLILLFSMVDQDAIDQRYGTPFRAKAEKAAAIRNAGFNQHGPGMSESDIFKRHGNRYDTY
jgi:hypothetical protein